MTDRVMKFFEECGDQAGDIIIKTDQEAAITYFVRNVVTERGNVVERAVQTVEGQIRVMKIAGSFGHPGGCWSECRDGVTVSSWSDMFWLKS